MRFCQGPTYRRPLNVFVARATVFVARATVFNGRATVFVARATVFNGRPTVFSGRRYGGLSVARPKNCQQSNLRRETIRCGRRHTDCKVFCGNALR